MLVSQRLNLPILTYHSIDDSGSVVSTSEDVFRRQMTYLSEQGFSAITLARLIKALNGQETLPEKTVVLTFDDGFQNFLTAAFPVLNNFGFAATVFLVTDFCGKHNDWEGNPPDLPRSSLLTWNEVRDLSENGIEFGVHSRTHPDLTKLPQKELESEVLESKAEIQNEIGKDVETFAYPFGKFDSNVKQFVEKNFTAACSTRLGKVRKGSDYFALDRVDAYYLQNLRVFNALSTSAFDRYLNLRGAMRSLKSFVRQN